MTREELERRHLAELHALAADRGVERYRLLPRERLIEAILAAGGERRERGGGLGLGRLLGRLLPGGGGGADERRAAAPAGEPAYVTGRLEIARRGHGFLCPGPERGGDDVFVSLSQIRRCRLKAGDEVSGPVREPRPGERHRSLGRVERVNGRAPEE